MPATYAITAGRRVISEAFYGNGMIIAGTGGIRQWLGSTGYGVACVEYAGFGVSSGSPSEHGCYRSADAAIAYLERQALTTPDQVALVGWSLGSAVAMDLASRRDVRAQVLLSPLTSLFATALDLVHLGKIKFTIGPFDALSKARSVHCPTLIVTGSRTPYPALDGKRVDESHGKPAQQVTLSGVGRNDMLNSGGTLWNVVNDFLKSSAGSGP